MYNKIHYIVPLRDDFLFTNDNSQNILYENNFVKELSALSAKPLHRGPTRVSVGCDGGSFSSPKERCKAALFWGGSPSYSLYSAPTGSSFAAR